VSDGYKHGTPKGVRIVRCLLAINIALLRSDDMLTIEPQRKRLLRMSSSK